MTTQPVTHARRVNACPECGDSNSLVVQYDVIVEARLTVSDTGISFAQEELDLDAESQMALAVKCRHCDWRQELPRVWAYHPQAATLDDIASLTRTPSHPVEDPLAADGTQSGAARPARPSRGR